MKAREAPQDPLRLRIWRAREAAHERACKTTHLDAGEIAHIADGFASRWAFKRAASSEQLQDAIRVMVLLHRATSAMEQLEARDAE